MPGPRANIDGRSIDRKPLSEAQIRAIVRDELAGLDDGGGIVALTMLGDVIGQSVGAEIQTQIDNGVIELNNFAGSVLTYLLARANHTGTQPASTITGLAAVATSGDKADVGLGNVDNTSDVDKPVSTAQAAADALRQPIDATLTALAAADWALNAMPVGTGADALSQVAIAANQFLARSSAGNVAAKAITDFGLSLIDDANAAAARATLGLIGTSYTPTLGNFANAPTRTAYVTTYSRVGDTVTVGGRLDVTPTAAGLCQVSIALPVASNFAANGDCGGTCVAFQNPPLPGAVSPDVATDVAVVSFYPTAVASHAVFFHFSYRVI